MTNPPRLCLAAVGAARFAKHPRRRACAALEMPGAAGRRRASIENRDLRSATAERTEVVGARHLAIDGRYASQRQALRVRLHDEAAEEVSRRGRSPRRDEHRLDGWLALSHPAARLLRQKRRTDSRERREHGPGATVDDDQIARDRARQLVRPLPQRVEALALQGEQIAVDEHERPGRFVLLSERFRTIDSRTPHIAHSSMIRHRTVRSPTARREQRAGPSPTPARWG